MPVCPNVKIFLQDGPWFLCSSPKVNLTLPVELVGVQKPVVAEIMRGEHNKLSVGVEGTFECDTFALLCGFLNSRESNWASFWSFS